MHCHRLQERARLVLSYHPVIEGDINRLCAGRKPDDEDLYWIRNCWAVILPQGCSEDLYWMARFNCPNVFPNYTFRFLYPGKVGQIRLFRTLGFSHPKSWLFSSVRNFPFHTVNQIKYPIVVKSSHGGEGEGVYLVGSPAELKRVLENLCRMEKTGLNGFLIQEFIPNNGMDLRIVILHDHIVAYWRMVPQGVVQFYHNVSRGAEIRRIKDMNEVSSAIQLVKELQQKTGINLAGLDIMFHREDKEKKHPLLIEINYYFGRTGLGGQEKYYNILKKAIYSWLRTIRPN